MKTLTFNQVMCINRISLFFLQTCLEKIKFIVLMKECDETKQVELTQQEDNIKNACMFIETYRKGF